MVIKDSPAKKIGILSWDLILKANWEDLKDKNLYDAVKLIKWPAWTIVKLTIQRVWEFETFEKEVTREKIIIPSVQSKVIEKENIWYIALNLFWDKTSEEFRIALKELKEKKVDGLIIDLRDNWWGYLQSAVEILSEFIESWNALVKTKYRDTVFNNVYNSLNTWEVYDKKIVVIVNGNSASASEITAWALREYNKAIIVWQKTYWKWSVQEPFDLSNWGLLKLTIAKWFTPKWRNIDKDGIDPDIEVILIKEDFEKAYDRQLEEAKNVLKSFIKNDALQLSVDKYKEAVEANKKTK
jgi:carboxyl-terminal processing protease